MPEDRPIVLVLNADQDRGDLVRQALKVGSENLAGELAGGMAAWRAAGVPQTTVGVEGIAAAHGTVLDVRQLSEYEAGHLHRGAEDRLDVATEPDLPRPPWLHHGLTFRQRSVPHGQLDVADELRELGGVWPELPLSSRSPLLTPARRIETGGRSGGSRLGAFLERWALRSAA